MVNEQKSTYPQDEIVDFIVDTHALEWGLKEDEIPVFKTWVRGIVRTYFYFQQR